MNYVDLARIRHVRSHAPWIADVVMNETLPEVPK